MTPILNEKRRRKSGGNGSLVLPHVIHEQPGRTTIMHGKPRHPEALKQLNETAVTL
jgi:hypothetical protein